MTGTRATFSFGGAVKRKQAISGPVKQSPRASPGSPVWMLPKATTGQGYPQHDGASIKPGAEIRRRASDKWASNKIKTNFDADGILGRRIYIAFDGRGRAPTAPTGPICVRYWSRRSTVVHAVTRSTKGISFGASAKRSESYESRNKAWKCVGSRVSLCSGITSQTRRPFQ